MMLVVQGYANGEAVCNQLWIGTDQGAGDQLGPHRNSFIHVFESQQSCQKCRDQVQALQPCHHIYHKDNGDPKNPKGWQK